MNVQATISGPLESGADTVAIGVFDGEEPAWDTPDGALAELLRTGEGSRKRSRLAQSRHGETRLLLVGLGARERWDAEQARVAAAVALQRARELGTRRLGWQLPAGTGAETAGGLVEGALLRAYRFDRYRRPREDQAEPETLILCSSDGDVSSAHDRAGILARAQNRARDLGNLAPNDLTPTALAQHAERLGERSGITVRVRDEERIRADGMGAFAAVAQGSAEPARLIELHYEGPGADGPLVALIGKAVTFDSGGLSLKPPVSMWEMKFDMCGGAAVIEAIAALGELGAPVRVLGLVGATENLPSSTSMRPGDIVRALDGTTIEINNTDAEGRLVLADLLTEARRQGAERLLDVATLTGAVTTALGSAYAGLMSNDDSWAQELLDAGERSGELLWRLPLHERYAEMVRGRYADITNRPERREAMAITAAEFLHHFVGEVPWAHLDIAAVSDDLPRRYLEKGASGFGVRLLVELLAPAGG